MACISSGNGGKALHATEGDGFLNHQQFEPPEGLAPEGG